MAGISDLSYRLINRSFWSGLAFTEMISANAMAYINKNTLQKLSPHPDDSPLGVQILGRDPEIVKRALDNLSEYTFDIIDFNAACPVKKVASKGKGAGLLKEPEKLQEILTLIVKKTDVPITVKIRSGWDEASVNAVETATRAQDAGVSGIFIHGRTRNQRYSGSVDYKIIRKVKEVLEIPVIASGDALTPELIKTMFSETGCDGVAVARGALGNPWIFRETERLLETGEAGPDPAVHEIVRTMKKHLLSIVELSGERTGIIHFRKFFSWYTRGLAMRELKVKAFRSGALDEMMKLINELEERENEKTLKYAGTISAETIAGSAPAYD
jgi:tRNA-dihydrouridine synthase B